MVGHSFDQPIVWLREELQIYKETTPGENKVSRRAFLTALLAGASAAVFAAGQPSEAEAPGAAVHLLPPSASRFPPAQPDARLSSSSSRRARQKDGEPRPVEAPAQ